MCAQMLCYSKEEQSGSHTKFSDLRIPSTTLAGPGDTCSAEYQDEWLAGGHVVCRGEFPVLPSNPLYFAEKAIPKLTDNDSNFAHGLVWHPIAPRSPHESGRRR